jgi:hypothetical protein
MATILVADNLTRKCLASILFLPHTDWSPEKLKWIFFSENELKLKNLISIPVKWICLGIGVVTFHEIS